MENIPHLHLPQPHFDNLFVLGIDIILHIRPVYSDHSLFFRVDGYNRAVGLDNLYQGKVAVLQTPLMGDNERKRCHRVISDDPFR